jgi:hypothetical protein
MQPCSKGGGESGHYYSECDIGAHRIERFVPYPERNPAPGTEDDAPQPPFTIDVRALRGS